MGKVRKSWTYAMFTILLWGMMSPTGSAQHEGMRFGLTASPTITFLKSDNQTVETDGVKLGINYGLLLDYNFAENYALTTGAMLGHSGGKLKDTDNGTFPPNKYNIRLQYIEIPIGIKMQTNEIGYITYWGKVGMLPAFRIRARGEVELYDSLGTKTTYENINLIGNNETPVRSKLLNFSLFVEVGIEYSLSGSTSLVAGILFQNGFPNVIKDDDEDKTVLRAPGLRLGVLF